MVSVVYLVHNLYLFKMYFQIIILRSGGNRLGPLVGVYGLVYIKFKLDLFLKIKKVEIFIEVGLAKKVGIWIVKKAF